MPKANINKNEERFADFLPPPPPPITNDNKTSKEERDNDHHSIVESLEEVVAGKWFTVIGVIVLVIGLGFLLGYAFKNNWITDVGKVVLGVVVGLAMLGIAEMTVRKYFIFGQVLAGGGVSMFFLSIYYGFEIYRIIPHWVAFFSMMLVVIAWAMMSVFHDTRRLMVMMVVGGFLTPIFITTRENNQVALFIYVLFLGASVLWVQFLKNWKELTLAGAIGTFFVFLRWYVIHYTPDQLWSTLTFLTIFFIIYSNASLVYNLIKKESVIGLEQLFIVVVSLFYFMVGKDLLQNLYGDNGVSLFAALIAIYYIILSFVARIVTPKDNALYGFLSVISASFLAIAIYLQFDRTIITMGFTIEGLLLIYIGLSSNQKLVEKLGLALGLFAILRLLLIDMEANLIDYKIIINKTLVLFVVVITACYLTSYMYRKFANNEDDSVKRIMLYCFIIASILIMVGGTVEINNYEKYQIIAINNQQRECNGSVGQLKCSNLKGGCVNLKNSCNQEEYQNLSAKIKNIENMASVATSVFWMIYAIVLLAFGFIKHNKISRVCGIFLLIFALIKLALHDFWWLGQLYRIVAFISLGIVLIAVSFVYQKYKDRIK